MGDTKHKEEEIEEKSTSTTEQDAEIITNEGEDPQIETTVETPKVDGREHAHFAEYEPVLDNVMIRIESKKESFPVIDVKEGKEITKELLVQKLFVEKVGSDCKIVEVGDEVFINSTGALQSFYIKDLENAYAFCKEHTITSIKK